MKDRADKLLKKGLINVSQLCEMLIDDVADEKEKQEIILRLQEQVNTIADVFNEDEEVVIYCMMKLWLKGLAHNLYFVKAFVDNIDFVGKMQKRFEKLI